MISNAPLRGIKILDLSRVLALPYATMILSDLGAQVIKIEKPLVGDETRGWGPPFLGSESAYFLCVNRNKKSITIDIRTKEGQKIIYDLSKVCDVFVENFKVGELKKYSLDYDTILKINPNIVYCSLTGFGQNGPKSNLPGYDFITQGISGLMSITGFPNGQPLKVGVAILDVIAGLYAAIGILSALFTKKNNGGEHIDISLYETAVASLVNVASNYLISNKIPKRYGNAHPNIVPYQTFKAKDKYFNLAVGNDEQFKKLANLLNLENTTIKKFKTNKDRVNKRKELIPILQNIFLTKTAKEWVELFQTNNIPVGHINNLKEVFEDNHLRQRKTLININHRFGNFKTVGLPLKFNKSKTVYPKPPPLLGEHTQEILENILGYSKETIDNLKSQKII